MSITPGASERDAAPARLTNRPPGVPGASGDDNLQGLGGGNLVGSWASGLDEAKGVQPGDGSLVDRDMPIGSALSNAQGRYAGTRGDALPTGTGNALDSGPQTLGATSGGERASAGTAPDARSSRSDANTLQSGSDGLE